MLKVRCKGFEGKLYNMGLCNDWDAETGEYTTTDMYYVRIGLDDDTEINLQNVKAEESDTSAQIKTDEPAHWTEQAPDNAMQTVTESTGNVEEVVCDELVHKEEPVFEEVIPKEALQMNEEQIPVEIIRTEKVQTLPTEAAVTAEAVEPEPLPELDFDIEKMIQESGEESETKKDNNHLGLWVPIVMLLMILLWLTVGMLMSYEIIPEFNLGYEWFNETLFELF